jgi:hypothetical protein
VDYNLVRTDRDGWIEIETDGQQMWITVEKGTDGETAAPEEE